MLPGLASRDFRLFKAGCRPARARPGRSRYRLAAWRSLAIGRRFRRSTCKSCSTSRRRTCSFRIQSRGHSSSRESRPSRSRASWAPWLRFHRPPAPGGWRSLAGCSRRYPGTFRRASSRASRPSRNMASWAAWLSRTRQHYPERWRRHRRGRNRRLSHDLPSSRESRLSRSRVSWAACMWHRRRRYFPGQSPARSAETCTSWGRRPAEAARKPEAPRHRHHHHERASSTSDVVVGFVASG